MTRWELSRPPTYFKILNRLLSHPLNNCFLLFLSQIDHNFLRKKIHSPLYFSIYGSPASSVFIVHKIILITYSNTYCTFNFFLVVMTPSFKNCRHFAITQKIRSGDTEFDHIINCAIYFNAMQYYGPLWILFGRRHFRNSRINVYIHFDAPRTSEIHNKPNINQIKGNKDPFCIKRFYLTLFLLFTSCASRLATKRLCAHFKHRAKYHSCKLRLNFHKMKSLR